MKTRLANLAISAVAAIALLGFVATPSARADERSRCQHAIEKAEARLDRAVHQHGERSHQADDRRRDLNAERERCWNEHHQWWNAREHRWETEHNWENRP